MDNRPIGIFDSGVGGLTVVKDVKELLPNESVVYIGDTARVPYGTRSSETITEYAGEIVHRLVKEDVKVLVVACNTISATCIPQLTKLTSTPLVDVINPTVREAIKQSRKKKIGVIGTNATIGSGIYEKLLRSLDPKVKVFSKATPLFVPIIEEGLFNHPVADLMIADYLQNLKNNMIDTLILGCTHYPLIKNKIAAFLPEVTIVESGRPTAHVLKELLTKENKLADKSKPATQIFFTSDRPEKSIKIARDFLGEDLELNRIKL